MSRFNIEISKTSSPNIVKFTANSFLTRASSYEFKNIDEAKPSPLAQQLFYLPFVKTVYISQNFIAIEKYNIVAWEDVQQEVADSILEYLNAGKPAILEQNATKKVPVSIYAESMRILLEVILLLYWLRCRQMQQCNILRNRCSLRLD